jgi:adenylate kinase family enzyme
VTFALQLGRLLDLPLIHLDRHYWQPGWVEPAPSVWERRVSELVRGDEWVMDGNYSGTLSQRLPRSDVAILLDPPTLVCLVGLFHRSVTRHGRDRPDLADGCSEHLPDLEFLRYVLSYKRRSRPKVLSRIRAAPQVHFVHLRSRREARSFLGALADQLH